MARSLFCLVLTCAESNAGKISNTASRQPARRFTMASPCRDRQIWRTPRRFPLRSQLLACAFPGGITKAGRRQFVHAVKAEAGGKEPRRRPPFGAESERSWGGSWRADTNVNG